MNESNLFPQQHIQPQPYFFEIIQFIHILDIYLTVCTLSFQKIYCANTPLGTSFGFFVRNFPRAHADRFHALLLIVVKCEMWKGQKWYEWNVKVIIAINHLEENDVFVISLELIDQNRTL
jgi:hypothetical protein